MTEWLALAGSFLGGLTSGSVFFGGLWLTVKKGATLKNPSLLFLASFLLRTALTLVVFYYVSSGSWQRLVVTLTGFLLARQLVFRFTKDPNASGNNLNKP